MDFMEIRNLYHIDGNVGYSKETIRKAINKFGRLPSVLTDYYQQLGKHRGLNHSDYHLCEPGKLDFLGRVSKMLSARCASQFVGDLCQMRGA